MKFVSCVMTLITRIADACAASWKLGKRLQGAAVDSSYQVVQNIYHDTDCALTVMLYSANRTAFI
jgi:hypothetical protein